MGSDELSPTHVAIRAWSENASWDIGGKIYSDIVYFQNRGTRALQLPLFGVLYRLENQCTATPTPPCTSESTTVSNPDGGGTRPPTTYWEWYDFDDEILSPNETIQNFVAFHAPYSEAFEFYGQIYKEMGKGPMASVGAFELGASVLSGGSGAAPDNGDDTFTFDDGIAEIHTGSTVGGLILANRFPLPSRMRLEEVTFEKGKGGEGAPATVVVYLDPTGTAAAPQAEMEIHRESIALGSAGVQSVDLDLVLDPLGNPGAAFFVGLEDPGGSEYALGVDLSSSGAGVSFVSEDGGESFRPISRLPIIDGVVMIRAFGTGEAICFVTAVDE